jgi:peptidoglycan/LPS O-acetylase OafA/YrhL
MVAVVDEMPAGPTTQHRPGEGYRPHLDGLRAVAVYLVVLYHAGADRFTGGFIGVDVFFVLSGYLVTQLLIRDLRSQGRVRLSRFYARRMRRLLPASLLALLVTGVVYSAIAARVDVVSSVNAFKAAFLYVANWFFIRRSADYFAANINTNPVIHFWSLAVEEQFYFLWPLLLSGLYLLTRRLRGNANRALQITVAAGAIASLFWALHLGGENLNRAYYGTDARAYQLLAGALIALSPGIVRRASRYRGPELAAAVSLAVLLVLSTSAFDMTAIHRGIATAIAASVLIIAIESARGGPVNRLLSTSPVVYLGRISYGTYLWHWPVIFVATQLVPGIQPVSSFAISAFVATGLASLSYTVLERPIRQERRLDRVNLAVVGVGLGIAVVAALVVVPRILDPQRSHSQVAQSAAATGFTPIPNLDFAAARSSVGPNLRGMTFVQNCFGKSPATCTIVKGTGKRILVIGDSHAEMFFPTFAKMARDKNLTVSTAAGPGCPWQRDLYLADDGIAQDAVFTRQCIASKRDLYSRVIPALKPDVIVAVSNDYLTRRPGMVLDSTGKALPAKTPQDLERLIRADTTRSLQALQQLAPKVLIIEPVPTTTLTNDPLVCLTKKKFLEDCRFVVSPDPTPLQLMYRSLADNKKTYVANFNKLVCPYFPICDPVIGGVIVRFDNQHISGTFAVSLAPAVTLFMQNAGLLPA